MRMRSKIGRCLVAAAALVIAVQSAASGQAPTEVRFVNACCPQFDWLDFKTTATKPALLARVNYGQSSTRLGASSSQIEAAKDDITIGSTQMNLANGKAHTVAIWGTANDIAFVQYEDKLDSEQHKTYLRFGLLSKYKPSSETTPLNLSVSCPSKTTLELKGIEGGFTTYSTIADLPQTECHLTVYQLGPNNQQMTVAERDALLREGGNYLVIFYGHSGNKLGILVETENR